MSCRSSNSGGNMTLRNKRCIQYWFAILWISCRTLIRIEAFTIRSAELLDVNDNRNVESRLLDAYLAKRELNHKHVSEPIEQYTTTEGEHNGINNVTSHSIYINNGRNATNEDKASENVESSPQNSSIQQLTPKIGITEYVNMYQFKESSKKIYNTNSTESQYDKIQTEDGNRLAKSLLPRDNADYLVNDSTDQSNSDKNATLPTLSPVTADTDNPNNNTTDENDHDNDPSKSVSLTTKSNIETKDKTEELLRHQKPNYDVLGFLTDSKSNKNIEKANNRYEIKQEAKKLQDVQDSVSFSNKLNSNLAGENNTTGNTILKSNEKIQIIIKPLDDNTNTKNTLQTAKSYSIKDETEVSDASSSGESSGVLSTISYEQDLSSKPDNSVRSLLLTVSQEEPITVKMDVSNPIEVLSTRRGGYLDISHGLFPPNTTPPAVSTPESLKATISVNNSTPSEPNIQVSSTDSSSHDDEEPVSKKDATKHIFDDADKEDELLMEKTISNNNDMAKIGKTSWDASSSPKVESDISAPNMSVMPISKVHTINPNYKPPKKIEISSPKPLFKHPDDNSWRNESISSLGIVFKPTTNSSKPLTQVLKTKLLEKAINETTKEKQSNDSPDLRERLEKLAEKRKIKNKKPGTEEGEADYVEISPMVVTTPTTSTAVRLTTRLTTEKVTTPLTTQDVYINTESFEPEIIKFKYTKPKLSAQDYDDDYSTVQVSPTSPSPSKKNTIPKTNSVLKLKNPLYHVYAKMVLPSPLTEYEPKVVPIDTTSDENFDRKVNLFTILEETTSSAPKTGITTSTADYKLTKSSVKEQPRIILKPHAEKANDERSPNLMIRHLKDLMDHAARDNFERARDFVQSLSESPVQGRAKPKPSTEIYDDYEYGPVYKNVNMHAYFKSVPKSVADIPVIYNNSVVHTEGDRLALSNAFVKQYYNFERRATKQPTHFLQQTKRYDPNCDRTVELSPAYELHYYVPDQEEMEELDRTAGGYYSNFQITGRFSQ